MSSPQPSGSMRRPPIARNDSSSPSLFGMERSIPSFQAFMKRTPPPDQSKPLPPVPLVPRRSLGGLPPRSRSPSLYNGRRASSVYSRTASMWADGDGLSFSSADFADEPMPPLPTLQPLAYSSSTPHLNEVARKALPSEPRAYNPLIMTPSPSPSPARSAPLKIIPPASPRTSQRRVQTISLEQAKRTHHAPGAIHLLPEELLAQTLKKRTSHEPVRLDSIAMFSSIHAPDLPEPPTLVDAQGRRRTIRHSRHQSIAGMPISAPIATASAARYAYGSSFKVGDGPERHMVSHLPEQNRRPSDGRVYDQEERGRAKERGRRISGSIKRFAAGRKPGIGVEGAYTVHNADQYRGLVSNPSDPRSMSPGYHDTDSDDSLKTRMKLVPQPLFKTKPPAKLPGTVSGHFHSNSRSPLGRDSSSGSPFSKRRTSNGSKTSFPFGLSLTPASSHRRQSTSGSIPISPPVGMFLTQHPAPEERRTPSPLRYQSTDARESAYYPFVASRKDKKPRAKPRHTGDSTFHSIDTGTERFRTPFGTPESMGSTSLRRTQSFGTDSNTSGGRKRPLFQRVAKGAAKYAELLTRPSESPSSRDDYFPQQPTPESPHLLPSPVQSPPAQHLGWSTKAKTAFDEARTSLTSPKRLIGSPPQTPMYTHIAAPARPLDETRIGLQESESPRRKASIFGGMLEGWMEGRAEKRREDLKKIITIIPGESRDSAPGLSRRSSTFGWM